MTSYQVNPSRLKQETIEASKRISGLVCKTPVEHSPYLSKLGNCDLFLKLESLQVTGSFKFRGAANHILSLTNEERKSGIVTASTGNHAAACASAAEHAKVPATIYLPENADK
ncbi:MAG: pyridoxal-phosphate dependent enzyme, partial [candidate division Zixibacteria bacterium]